MKKMKLFFAGVLLTAFTALLSGCNVTMACYGFDCDNPYYNGYQNNPGLQMERAGQAGTEHPWGYYYRPGLYR